MTSLRFASLVSGYGASIVLRSVDLSIAEGEAVAIVGRNGAGKTTLLLSVFRETDISAGAIWVGDTNIAAMPGYSAAKLGISIAPQGRRILPNLTVRENLLLGGATGRPGPWNLERVYELFPVLCERAGSAGTMLSGGQQQMLSIGRALMANPAILLLDEPSEGLSPLLIDGLAAALTRIRAAGTGLLVVEQHLNLVKRTTDRFVVMSKGQIVGTGDIGDIDAPQNQALIAF